MAIAASITEGATRPVGGFRQSAAVRYAPMVPEGAGDRIRRYRRLRGLSQQQLADLAETDKGYISRLEAGRIEAPGVDVFKRIAQALNAPLRTLAEPLGWYDDDPANGDWEAAIMADPRFPDESKQALVHILKGLLPNKD